MGNVVFAAVTPNKVNLVFHECNKRRNNYRASLTDHCRQLITQTFTPTSRLDYEGVITIKYIMNDGFLVTSESVKSKILTQGSLKIC